MSSVAQLQYSPLAGKCRHQSNLDRQISCRLSPNIPYKKLSFNSVQNLTAFSVQSKLFNPSLVSNFHPLLCAAGGGGNAGVGQGGGRGGDHGGSGGWSGGGKSDSSSPLDSFGLIGLFLSGWRSRVAADPQFPFKVLMEEIVGVSACVLGDMASRPNFGLNELDFVFSTLVVGSIMNFTLMYLLAPTMSSASASLPSIFANSPTSHMFEPGPYSIVNRLGTFVYKGTVFAAVGFAAGLVGTALSNGLIKLRKKMDPSFEPPNKPPPTVLNAITWAIHMGLSSNFRYQTLNGIEFLLAKGLSPVAFKTSVVGLRLVNNVLGGMSFVVLARLTGSQSSSGEKEAKKINSVVDTDGSDSPTGSKEKVKLLSEDFDNGNEAP